MANKIHIDFDKVREESITRIDSLVSQWLQGERGGKEFIAINPTRNDIHPGSFNINLDTGVWDDFADASIDPKLKSNPIGLYAYLQNISWVEAARALAEQFGMTDSSDDEHITDTKPKKKGRKLHLKPPAQGYIKKWKSRFYSPTNTWLYEDFINDEFVEVAMIYRFELDGKKTFMQLRKVEDGWMWGSLPGKRPLYNLREILLSLEKDIMIHEGEKSVDAGKEIFPDKVHTTTMQGANSALKSNFKPLLGRNVYIFPDNDDNGKSYANNVIDLLKKHKAQSIKVLKIPDNWPEKCDAADCLNKKSSKFEWLSIDEFDAKKIDNDEVNDFVYIGDSLFYKKYYQNSVKEELVYPGRITITQEGNDIISGKTYLSIRFETPSGIKNVTFPQEKVATRRGILELAGLGASLPESRALLLSQYLIDLNHNKDVKRIRQTNLLGRIENGMVLPHGTANTDIQYQGHASISAGENKTIYRDVLKEVLTTWGPDSWPFVMLLGFSLSAPFIKFAKLTRNPCIAFVGTSGYGKTTVAKYCIAAWANPERAPFKMEGSTANTQIGVEQNISRLVYLPFLVDEIHKMSTNPTGKGVVFDNLLYTVSNGETRLIGSLDEETRGGKEITGVMFAAGEDLPPLFNKGAFNRLIVVNVDNFPPLGIAGIDGKGNQNSKGLDRVLLLDETRRLGCGWFGLDFFKYAVDNESELKKIFDSQLASEDIRILGHHRKTFALVMSVLHMVCKMLKIKVPDSVVGIPEYGRRIITELSYGGEHDPDTVAFENVMTMINAADEAVIRENGREVGKGYYRLAGETVCFKRHVRGKQFMYIPTSTKAFKSYVGEGGGKRYFQAWLRSSLIEPTKDGKPTHSVRGVNSAKKVRCIMIPLKDDENDNENDE